MKPIETKMSSDIPITPLDEIRQAEARISAQMLLARQEADAVKQQSKIRAKEIIEQSQQSGAQAGQARYEELVREAAQEASGMIADARARAEIIAQDGPAQKSKAALWGLNVVLGLVREDRVP